MDWVTDQIAIGNVDDAVNRRQLEKVGITAVLSLHWFPAPVLDEPLVQCQVVLDDGPGTTVELLHEAICALDALLIEHKVLVHCMEGASRSPFVVACHIALRDKIGLLEALGLIAEKRKIGISPYFYPLWDEYVIWKNDGKGSLV